MREIFAAVRAGFREGVRSGAWRALLAPLRLVGWLARTLFEPFDDAAQGAVNALVWTLEDRGVTRRQMTYAFDAITVCMVVVMGFVARIFLPINIACALVLLYCMHRPAYQGRNDLDATPLPKPRSPHVILVRATYLWCTLSHVAIRLTPHLPWRGADTFQVVYYAALYAGSCLNEAPRRPPPKPKREPVKTEAVQPGLA